MLAEARADAPDHAGDVGVAEQRQVRIVDLQVEALAPGLEQMRAVELPDRGAHDADRLAGADDRDAHEVGVVAGDRLAALGDRDPALLGQRRRVDEVDVLLGATGEDAREHGQGEQARVALGDPPHVLDLDALDVVGEPGGDAAEPLRERDVRAEDLHVLRADGGDVDRGRDDAAGQGEHDLLGRLDARAVLRLGRRGAEVRRDDDVGVAEQRVIGDRLLGEDVERRAGDLAGVQRRLQVRVDDERAAGDVDDPHAVLALGERLGVQEALGLRRLRQVQRDEVTGRERVRGGLGLLDAELLEALGADEGVVRDDAHAEGAGADRDELADPAEAEHAEGLALDLGAAELAALPLAAGEAGVRLRDVAGEREHQRERVLGRGDRVGLRRVGDDDPALGRGGDVDVVHADAGTADDAQVVGALDRLGVELRRAADQDAVVAADAIEQLLAGPVGAEVDVEALAQHVDAGLGDLLRDEDAVLLCQQAHAAAGTASAWPCWAGGSGPRS